MIAPAVPDSAMSGSTMTGRALAHLRIVLVRPRFPENIGSVARAAANFGCSSLILVQPERWDLERGDRDKALPLATSQGKTVLDNLIVVDSLAQAVAPCSLVIGTTARTGGWRRRISLPRQAAAEAAARLTEGGAQGEKVALVFGPEDRGLSNADLECCNALVNIPTAPGASSLNLAQAVLLVLYECFLALPQAKARPSGKRELSRRITQEERELLHAALKRALTGIDVLPADNPDYFFLPLAAFFDRADVRRHEMDLFMGICRQILNRENTGNKGNTP